MLVKAADVARHLAVTEETIYRYAREGRLPCVRLSKNAVRFRLTDVEQALSGQPQRHNPEPVRAA